MNLRNIDLNLLVVLDALLEERSVTRAGERVGLSQSATSAALSRLREILHDPILVRVGRELALTPNAERLVDPLRDALSRVERTLTLQPDFNPLVSSQSFTISASDYVVLILLVPFINTLTAEAPNVTIHLVPRSRDAERVLQTDQVDIVIEPSELLVNNGYPSVPLFSDRWLCAVDVNHPLVRAPGISMDQFLMLPHLAYGIGQDRQSNLADQHLTRLKIKRRIQVTVESFLLVPFLLQGSQLISLVLERTIERLVGATTVRGLAPPIELPDIHETMYWHPRHTSDPGHRWLRERLHAIAQGLQR